MTLSMNPEKRERDLVWGILLTLRARRGIEKIDNSGGLLHAAFSKLLDEDATSVREALGFVPTPHPLFGEFRCITEALDRAHRAGLVSFLNPSYREIVLKVRPDAAETLLGRLSVSVEESERLADSLWKHYQAAGA